MGTGFIQGYSGRGVKLTIHLHLVLRLRMRGGIHPLPHYAFMAWCLIKHGNSFIFCHLRLDLPSGLFRSQFRIKILYILIIFPMVSSTYLTLLD